jgi:hypothetical protein
MVANALPKYSGALVITVILVVQSVRRNSSTNIFGMAQVFGDFGRAIRSPQARYQNIRGHL